MWICMYSICKVGKPLRSLITSLFNVKNEVTSTKSEKKMFLILVEIYYIYFIFYILSLYFVLVILYTFILFILSILSIHSILCILCILCILYILYFIFYIWKWLEKFFVSWKVLDETKDFVFVYIETGNAIFCVCTTFIQKIIFPAFRKYIFR